MITLTFALPAESSAFIRRLTGRKSRRQTGLTICSGRMGGHEVEVIHTGVGKVAAGENLGEYLNTRHPTLLISSGFAGAARSNFRVGDLLLVPNFSESSLLALARRALRDQNVHEVKLFTASGMIDSAEEREQIWRGQEAAAIDMESEAIAAVCAKRGVLMLSLRVLSDTPRHPFPLPGELLFDLERQRTPMARLLWHLLLHPRDLPKLIAFARQIARARRALTQGLVKLMQADLP